jgi:hypothetical protein
MDVEEEARETASEIREEAFGHRPKMSLDVFWQILVVVFLIMDTFNAQWRGRIVTYTYLIPQGP